MTTTRTLSALAESFFTDRLMRQRQASPHTLASYRDTFCLLLRFAKRRLGKEPGDLTVEDLDAELIAAFLDHLEKDRGNSARTRNQRLAAIHSFFRYASFKAPECSALIHRVLEIPSKRHSRPVIDFLSVPEIHALLAAPDRSTWVGRRDHALLLLAVQTGLRASELKGLCRQDVTLGPGAHVRCIGKGRKERCTPLTKEAVAVLRSWMKEPGAGADPAASLFPNARGRPISRHGIHFLVTKHAATAQRRCPALRAKRISPHVLRHTTAMQLLQSGVDCSVIALWLGHESVETTQVYVQANMEMKEKILTKTAPLNVRASRYRPPDRLLTFLRGL